MMTADRHTPAILGAVVICTLPHFLNISYLAAAMCLVMWCYILAAAKYTWPLPGRTAGRVAAAFFFTAAMTTHEGLTLEAFVALLALMVNLKLLEVRAGRDRIITVILCYFLIVTGLFFGDSIGATSYLLFAILCTTAVLIHVNHPRRGLSPPLRLSGILMVQALPVALILFLLFPRIQGGLWGRAPVSSARTGFSDTMSFGNVAELARSSEVAFRVEFDGPPPSRDLLYWRGIVLWEFDGTTWSRGIRRRSATIRPPETLRKIGYTVILEPHNEHWLLALDLPLRINFHRAWLNSDHTGYRWWPITQRIRYKGVSDPEASARRDEALSDEALQLPPSGNPRARTLAGELAGKAPDTAGYVNSVLAYYREQPFFYTLKPPPLAGTGSGKAGAEPDLVDAFLFGTRRGFCEHFAGSFAFLMRAAGIPARVVVGYQGGSLNNYGGYLIVRQSDAHAWCEVWMEERGWVRVDPTAAVAPERLQGETADALQAGEAADLISRIRRGAFGTWLGDVFGMMDYMNSKWNRWVMDYDPYGDSDFLARLDIDLETRQGWGQALLIALVGGAAAAALVLVLFRSSLRHRETDEIARAWTLYCQKLAAIGFPRRPAQGPVEYMVQVAGHRPELQDRLEKITSLYIRLRYGNQGGMRDIESLKALVEKFTPPRTSP
jgi:transglutaminase-like putative cysteine protease